jgi:uncharacterized protein YbjT (DUF2867 family)
MKSTVLVLGATGMVGSHVARSLSDRGEPVRAFVRDPGRAAQMLGGTVPLAVGDLTEPATLDTALDGVDRVLLCLGNRPDQAHLEISVIDACRRAGVRRVVKISAKGAQVGSPVPFWDQHARIEDHLRRSGISSVILRPSTYASNLLASAQPVQAMGRLFAPAGTAPVAFIDPRDVAAVAVAALLDPAHDGHTYTLTGPEALTFAEVAERWSTVIGQPVEYVDIPDEAARAAMLEAGLPPWLTDGIVAVFGQLRHGVASTVNDQVQQILGRRPGAVGDFLRAFGVAEPVAAR